MRYNGRAIFSGRNDDAGEGDAGAGAEGCARRKICLDAGRGVRARGDAPRARGKARREIHKAGDRDRIVEGAAVGGAVPSSAEGSGVEADADAGGAGCGEGPEAREKSFGDEIEGGEG